MENECLIDTSFVQALVDKNDQHHKWARRLLPRIRRYHSVITEFVFSEVAAALASVNRSEVAKFIRRSYLVANISVVEVNHDLFIRGLELYESRPDKAWSLVDCISFLVMDDKKIVWAASTDHHFEQAGFQLLR